MQMKFRQLAVFLLAICGLAFSVHPSGFADEEETRPGLHAVLSDANHSVSTTSRRMSFDWTDSFPDSRLKGEFKGDWKGSLLVRQPGRHSFHAIVSGRVTITVDDSPVLEATGENIFHSAEAVELSAGDHRLQIEFEHLASVDAKLQLFWSSPEFTLEPLPADALSHEAIDPAVAHAESGRFLADALRCSACHSDLEEIPTLKAPSLLRVNELSPARVVSRLMNPHTSSGDSMMPAFGFSLEEAQYVAAFLADVATKESATADVGVKFEPEDAEAGTKLLLTTGCMACHSLSLLSETKIPGANPYHGPSLNGVSERRSVPWLMTWLKSPELLNVDHRMPVFALSDDERRQIVAAMVEADRGASGDKTQQETEDSLGPRGSKSRDGINVGRRLVMEANCAGCHRIAGVEAARKQPKVAWAAKLTEDKSCVTTANTKRRTGHKERQPSFTLSEQHYLQLTTWLTSVTSGLRANTGAAKGELLIHRGGCLSCHDRDQHRGLSQFTGMIEAKRDDLRGQSQALIPPALTAVGDRLRDEYLHTALTGEQTSRRLPWLLVRMPKFGFSPDDRADIVKHFVASDRIPDSADVARPELFEHLNPHHPSVATANDLLIGNQLIGAGGFNCIACHKAGEYEPRNVAMGTRGSDIMTMGQRLRPRYFMRWMQNPIRVVPGIEMPALRKAIPGVLEDSLSQQISMMWKALADPKFSPPTVVSRYEQFITVAPGQRPRIIRDVFTIGDPKERNSVARAFAVGFNNGHNVLIDLDTLQLRQWTIGEFARQRTEGKSWFWDMAGVSVTMKPAGILAGTLKNLDSPNSPPLVPVIDQRRHAELLSWKLTETAVSLRIRYHYDEVGRDSKAAVPAVDQLSPHSVITAWNDPARTLLTAIVNYTLQPTNSSEDSTGWEITATAEDCPNGYSMQLDSWRSEDSSGEIPWAASVVSDFGDAAVTASSKGQTATLIMKTNVVPPAIIPPSLPKSISLAEPIAALPGFEGRRLPIDTAIMPTAMTWLDDGRLAFVSLRGQVWIAKDTNHDKLVDSLTLFAEGLAAPYGIQADGDSILVSHKPEVIRLRDSNRDGTADEFDVFASGWGFSDDYHDWTTALARDKNGNYFVGLGSDYSQKDRPADNDRWRGTVLKIDSTGAITPVAYSFRFPMSLAFDRDQHLFATDNQGVQNTFNEINHIVMGKHYGVPSRHDDVLRVVAETPALMVPHPWTRSVNSIVFFPVDFAVPELAGHGVGCEYDTRCLIRFTVQDVGGTLQGASYRFSLPDQPSGSGNFVGPVSSAIGPDGALYIGSIWDSGWQGGTNTGTIERVVPTKSMPNGIREIRATATGFDVSFFHPVDAAKATDLRNWSLQGYTRAWGGSYATPDSDRHSLTPTLIALSGDHKSVSIAVSPLKPGYVYEISVKQALDNSERGKFWPTEGHYTMKVVPK